MDGKINLYLLLETAKKHLALVRRLNDPIMANSIETRIKTLQILMMEARQEVEDYANVGVENRNIEEVGIWNRYWRLNKDYHQTAEKIEAAHIKKIIGSKEEEIPDEFLCPIGISIMMEPVSLVFNGIPENKCNYEKSNISKWLTENNYDPITRSQPVTMANYVPNEELTRQITAYFNNPYSAGARRKVKQTKKEQYKRRQYKRRQSKRRQSKRRQSKRRQSKRRQSNIHY